MDTDFEKCLRTHMENHPCEEAQDVVKFCYQAAFGAEHLLKDRAAARNWLMEEYEAVPALDGELSETLNETYSRVSFSAWKAMGRTPDELFDLFVRSAERTAEKHDDETDQARFQKYLSTAEHLISESSQGTITLDSWKAFLSSYLPDSGKPVRHSEIYREQYAPAYRLIRNDLLEMALSN